MSAPLAGPCGDCCTRTVQHSGTPRGTTELIAGLTTYIARPNSQLNSSHHEAKPEAEAEARPAKVILFFADVFGPLYVNSKLAMDYWAENGAYARRLALPHSQSD